MSACPPTHATFNKDLSSVAADTKWSGTPSQIEWAEQIRPRAIAEFDRVAKALLAASAKQPEQDRADSLALIAILEEKRAEVMANCQAGYFIREWQELTDQVRRMIGQDFRYAAIKARKAGARLAARNATQGFPPVFRKPECGLDRPIVSR
jgi:hypothetical protein